MLGNWSPSRRTLLGATGAAVLGAAVGTAHRSAAAPLLPVRCTDRYQGYRAQDRTLPYSAFMADETALAPRVVLDAHASCDGRNVRLMVRLARSSGPPDGWLRGPSDVAPRSIQPIWW
ncbi:hypothetical protein QMK17_05990 [Rhodococcus sp. G-MC3]|uniref:hypothetical protein n=1 Tax=Rhodococcus sp. G-MC3 TaxID=3046209 RepID=UPI0024BB8D60|nr:hypothetical protein [Rhodococcus sp. G-MC3]MDJ0392879.1 hypothetical protein [Rhodococcus sp. G-MC3]